MRFRTMLGGVAAALLFAVASPSASAQHFGGHGSGGHRGGFSFSFGVHGGHHRSYRTHGGYGYFSGGHDYYYRGGHGYRPHYRSHSYRPHYRGHSYRARYRRHHGRWH